MTDHSSASIRTPKNWQDFERNSRVLFECILNDVHVQNNGRTGQPQHGVDIFGRRNGEGANWFGIQCKGKDANYGGKVTEKELREEVEKSRTFTPAISDFILITTAPVDASIQAVARTITEEREKEGNALNVSVWGWGELETRISEHPRALQAFEPDASPYSDQILSETTYLRNKADESSETLEAILQGVQSFNRTLQTGDDTSAIHEVVDKNLHAEIDGYRDIAKDGKPLTSLGLLETLKERVWNTASDRIKFRIITNIGSAKLYISKEKEAEATEHFLEAIQYQPEDKIALANVALAYLLKNEQAKAIDAAKTALEKDETNAEAASYLIQAYIKDDSVNDPSKFVTDAVKETASVDIAIINFYRTRNDLLWVDSAKKAVHRHPDDERLIRFAAEAELETALSARGLLSGQKPANPINVDALRKAAEVLQKLWDKQYNSELPDLDFSLPHNLTLLYKTINENELAKTVVVQAIEKMPDVQDIIKLRAGFYLEDNQTQNAVTLLQKVSNDPEAILILAEIQAKNDTVSALKTLENIEKTKRLEDRHRIMAGELRIESWLSHPELSKEDRIKEATKEYDALMAEYSGNPLVALMHSQIFEAADDDLELNNALKNAKSLLKDDSSFYERYMVARRFETLEGYSDAADILEGYVDCSHDSPPLRTLFFSLIKSDRRAHAYELLSAMHKEVAGQPFFLSAAISLHFRRGDYAAAESATNKFLGLQPNDLHTHLNRVGIWLRQRNEGAIHEFLATEVENLEGTPEEFMQLALLLDRFEQHERALELGYKTHIENRRDPQIQLAYMGLLLKPGSSTKFNLEKTTVGNNTAFTIKNADDEKETFVVEEDEALRLIDEAVAPTHLFVAAANGLKRGDIFQIHDGEDWEIVSVKHKYLYLLHTNMESFERHFPENGGLQRFTIKEEDGNKSLEPVMQKIKEKHDTNELILDKYKELPLPLEVFAGWLGADVIEAWYGLAQTGREFKVCHGSTQERVVAFKAIEENNKAGCVVDALTLHIIRLLAIEEVIAEICGPISVTESTIDTFRYRRELVLSHGEQPFMTVFWSDGQYYRDEVTKERLKQILASHEQELDWIEQQIEVLSAESNEIVPDEAGRIRDALSYNFLDPILAAQGSDRLLLCEDRSYRQFGVSEFHLRASWLQPVLMLAIEREVLSKEKYSEVICNLVSSGHSFTSVDTNLLTCVLDRSEKDFQTVTKALFGADAEIGSHLRVMIAILHSIWSKNVEPYLLEKSATSILLRRLFFGEWRNNIKDSSVENTISLLTPLMHNHQFMNYLHGWLRGHFLLPIDSDA